MIQNVVKSGNPVIFFGALAFLIISIGAIVMYYRYVMAKEKQRKEQEAKKQAQRDSQKPIKKKHKSN